jgi:hypothetical protein
MDECVERDLTNKVGYAKPPPGTPRPVSPSLGDREGLQLIRHGYVVVPDPKIVPIQLNQAATRDRRLVIKSVRGAVASAAHRCGVTRLFS